MFWAENAPRFRLQNPIPPTHGCVGFLEGFYEEGAEHVQRRFLEAIEGKVSVVVTAVNLCEVYYDCLRVKGVEEARRLLSEIEGLPLTVLRVVDNPLIEMAGRFKVAENVSLADAFALAASRLLDARLMSSDHHEFDSISVKGEISFDWIR